MAAAGVEFEDGNRREHGTYANGEAVIREIRRRARAGLPLNTKAIALSKPGDIRLYSSACRDFGSWSEAVEAAGLDYENIRRPRNPYRAKRSVIREIRRRKRAGLPLTVAELRTGEHRDQCLLGAALREYGKWSAATRAAGVKYPRNRNQHDQEPA